ncbi:MAG: hypothetical protein MR639_13315 [Clostridium sp.]|uniref:hypothetical protein n=1 Tax=Clostridium sp. TaxID=1506 RepID=UPI002A8F265B|nr:hypothetical protein [Clostridium sp.]MDY5096942.1 hypothetical protein [Clostridium sp.]
MDFMLNPYYSLVRNVPRGKNYKSLEEVLEKSSNIISLLKYSKLLNEYLLTLAPSIKYKEMLLTISDDDMSHKNLIKEIYCFFENTPLEESKINFEVPSTYKEGILTIKKIKLDIMLFYKDMINSLTNEYYKGLAFELFTDILIHNDFYNYVLMSL